MDPSHLPPIPTAIHLNNNYQSDSIDSSPAAADADDPLPPVPGAKLRLMCSYGGHIMPRPHDKSLCYVGGETRIVALDRHSSLAAISSRLSRTLLAGRLFSLKYQLPNEDLDSLVSVSTDEDLENMIEEYDRLASSGSSGRIRLFVFFNKPETAASMGALLADSKSETWFVDALNGSGLIPRNLSDSAAMDTLLNLGSDAVETEEDFSEQGKNNASTHEVQNSISDSPAVENTTSSSFGSSSSSSMANLPPIRVRVEDNGAMVQEQRTGIEEQFAQMSFGVSASSMVHPPGGSSENLGRVLSDDERSDQGVPVGYRKPPLPLQPSPHRPAAAYANVPSPDSVASDSSIQSANSASKMMYYHEQVQVASRDFRTPMIPSSNADPHAHSPIHVQQRAQDSAFTMPSQPDPHSQQQQQQQQPFMHTSVHYIPHHTPSGMPMQSYYPVYTTPTQQQYHPMYMMPGQYMSVQSSMADQAGSGHQLAPPNSNTAYKDVPPLYPAKAAAPTKPEMGAGVYGTGVTSAPQMVQVSSNQYQHQYPGGYSVMHHPGQSVIATPGGGGGGVGANYAYEYANAGQDQVYYAQHQAVQLPQQYQTMTPAAAVAALADASKQLQNESAMSQARSSQPQ